MPITFQVLSVSLWGWANSFSQWNKLCLATQDDGRLWNCYSTCLSHSSLRTCWDQALKPKYEDTYDVFEGVPSHLVLGNKHSRTWWEFTLLPSFIMEVKSELMHEQQCSFVCYNVSFLLFCVPNVKKTIHASIKILILLRNNFL